MTRRSLTATLLWVGSIPCNAQCTSADDLALAEAGCASAAMCEAASASGTAGDTAEPATGGGAVGVGGASAEAGEAMVEAGGSGAGAPVSDGGASAEAGASGGAGWLVCHDGGPGEGATCASYCAAWFPICRENDSTRDVFADEAACLQHCAAFAEAQLCCRGYHVTNAPERPTTHCTHAAGFRICP